MIDLVMNLEHYGIQMTLCISLAKFSSRPVEFGGYN